MTPRSRSSTRTVRVPDTLVRAAIRATLTREPATPVDLAAALGEGTSVSTVEDLARDMAKSGEIIMERSETRRSDTHPEEGFYPAFRWPTQEELDEITRREERGAQLRALADAVAVRLGIDPGRVRLADEFVTINLRDVAAQQAESAAALRVLGALDEVIP